MLIMFVYLMALTPKPSSSSQLGFIQTGCNKTIALGSSLALAQQLDPTRHEAINSLSTLEDYENISKVVRSVWCDILSCETVNSNEKPNKMPHFNSFQQHKMLYKTSCSIVCFVCVLYTLQFCGFSKICTYTQHNAGKFDSHFVVKSNGYKRHCSRMKRRHEIDDFSRRRNSIGSLFSRKQQHKFNEDEARSCCEMFVPMCAVYYRVQVQTHRHII